MTAAPPAETPVVGSGLDRPWTGPKRPYDLVKEFVVALVVVGVLSVVLALILSSPDEKGVTLQQWALQDPADFVATAISELAGTSTSASYGPPYNTASTGQPDFLSPPAELDRGPPARRPSQRLRAGPSRHCGRQPDADRSPGAIQTRISRRSSKPGRPLTQKPSPAPPTAIRQGPPGGYGPVPTLTTALLHLAQTGALDSQLVSHGSGFYGDNYTKPLLFLADGTFLANLANAQHLSGDQWGMMNETGNFLGQAWLWLYTMWYQISPFNSSGNADALVWGIMMILSLALILLPVIPGLRSIPRFVPVYRLIWRDYYRDHQARRSRNHDRDPAHRPVVSRNGDDQG